MPRKKKLDYLQPCRLLVDLPEYKLKAGARGTVLDTYLRSKRWYHVEFLTKRLYRIEMRALEENEIEGIPFDYGPALVQSTRRESKKSVRGSRVSTRKRPRNPRKSAGP